MAPSDGAPAYYSEKEVIDLINDSTEQISIAWVKGWAWGMLAGVMFMRHIWPLFFQ